MAVQTNLLSANDSTLDSTVGTWAAGSNTTAVRVTTPTPHTGAGCLRLTSGAAGTMTAFTGKYTVSPSTVYMATGWAANVSAAAGRVIQISVDWWTSGDVYISSSVGAPTTTLPNSTAWTGPMVVIGTSPVNAAKASLVVTVTAGITAGSQQIVFDDFAMGVPFSESGNILPLDVYTVEMSTAGWTAGTNATIARSGGSAEGAYCLRVTSTAAGDTLVTTTDRYAVTAGQLYEVFTWIFPPGAGRSVILEARWYDASVGGTLLSTSAYTATTVQTSIWERHTLSATAPPGATHVVMAMRQQAVGAAEVWFYDVMVVRLAPLVAGNLLSYPAQSLEVDAADWTAAGNCAIARSAPAEMAYAGAYSLKATCTVAGQARIELTTAVPVTEGLYYNAGVQFRTVGASPASRVWLAIDWYDVSDVYLGSAEPDQESAQVGGAWHMETLGRQAPVGAAKAKLVLLPQATVSSQVFYLDEMSLASGTPPYVVEPDPATGSVTITLNDLAGSTTLDLRRVDPDGQLSPVRGFVSDVVGYDVTGPTMVFEDYEAPLGVTLRYEYTKHPSELTTRTYAVTLDPPDDPGHVWLTNPGQPALNILLTVGQAPNWKRSIERGIQRAVGAKLPQVVSDVRAGREGDLAAVTWTADEADALDYLLDAGGALLIRARPGWGLDKAYVSVGDIGEDRVSRYGPQPVRRWQLPLLLVDRPGGGMAGSADRTWQDVLDDPETPTWGDLPTKYPTWLHVFQGVD
ncbi:hypothetical protein OG216_09600 [Streptomycetaceae bacterium NBC_01309]